MKLRRNWMIGIALSTAAAGFLALQSVRAPGQNGESLDSAVPVSEVVPAETETPTPQPQGGCAFVWAYHEAPELSERLDAAVKSLDPGASADAVYFGEDCVYADGTSTFGVMETDFFVRLPVEDLSDEEAFGDWMAGVMEIVEQIPEEEIQGNWGFVEFSFIRNENEQIVLRVPIQKYMGEAREKKGAELFRMFYTPP